MYGWEFPPIISGGLGIACYSIVQELARRSGIDVTLVLPYKTEGITVNPRVKIIGCDAIFAGIAKNQSESAFQAGEGLEGWFLKNLNPYSYPKDKDYLSCLEDAEKKAAFIIEKLKSLGAITISDLEALKSSSNIINARYGENLLEDVCHYAILAGALATIVPHDVIHAHDWLTVLAGIQAKKHSGKPLIFHVHALEPDRSGLCVDSRIFAIEKYGMEQADKIVTVSEYTKNIVVEKYGIDPRKIEVVYNGISYDEISPQNLGFLQKTKMVLFLGRLVPQKNPFAFIEAAKKILDLRCDVHFVVAGTGGLMRELIERVAALRIGKNVHFLGFLDHKNISNAFRLADVYVMPSVSEPFGLTGLEALAHEVPVIISKQSGVSEVLPHVLKVDFWDVDEMANKILAFLDHPPLRKVILEESQQDLHAVTWERTAVSLEKLYNSLGEVKS